MGGQAMCLKTYQIEPMTAEKDFNVYKVLIHDEKTDKYYSPFSMLPYEYKKGQTHKPERSYILDEDAYYSKEYTGRNNGQDFRQVKEGWLHSYRSKVFASISCDQLNTPYKCGGDGDFKKCVVIPMRIPKGSRYYISVDGVEMCSDRLIWENEQ